MKIYEITLLISPELSDDELKSLQERISSLIQAQEGKLIDKNSLVKKDLAYPINKKVEAFLMTLSFYLAQEKLAFLEKELRQEPKILRYIILKKREREFAKIGPKRIELGIRKFFRREIPTEKLKQKVELKEIEKKLDEILGET